MCSRVWPRRRYPSAKGAGLRQRTQRFETVILPHLDAAYNLARWLVRDERDAQDVVQEAALRALRYFDGFEGDAGRPWLLGIVRNAAYSWLRARGASREELRLDAGQDGEPEELPSPGPGPEQQLLLKLDALRVNRAIAELPAGYREVIILRELEDLSYEEISRVAGIPAGTVMSRLFRARALLRAALADGQEQGR